MKNINTIINVVKSHLSQFNFIEIDFEIQDNILLINLYPRFEFIEINKDIFKLIEVIETEIDVNCYKINVYKTLNNYINR